MGRPTAIPGTLTLQDSETRGQEETAHAWHPSRWSPEPWLLVPQDPLLAVVFSCRLKFPQAHRLTAYHPSSKSIFDPHLLAQQKFIMSNGVQLWNQDSGVPAPALTMGCNQHAHTFLGLSCYSRSRAGLCNQLSCVKPEACVFPESFASAVVVTHDDEIIFYSSNEVTAVIPL